MKLEKIHEQESLPQTFEGFHPHEKGAFYHCFVMAIGEDVAFDYKELGKCYLALPDSIKADILLLTLHNEAVQAKITDWIKSNYIELM
jgi:hypothetical protein